MMSILMSHMKVIKIGFVNILRVFNDHHTCVKIEFIMCEPHCVKFLWTS